jgi:hypothetical protein
MRMVTKWKCFSCGRTNASERREGRHHSLEITKDFTILCINNIVLVVTVAAIIMMNSCAFFAGSPHDNFKAHLYHTIGINIDSIPYYQMPSKQSLISSRELPNGNIENKYMHRGTCVYFIELDPKTRIIVGARFEGSESDCVVNP